MKNASTAQLVAIVQASADRLAFNELFSRYDGKLRAFLSFKSAEQRANVDDLLQETYVKAFLNIQQFNQQAQFSTWLIRIAFNEMLQAKRSLNIFRRLQEKWFQHNPEAELQQDNFALHLAAVQAMADLSPLQQQVFVYNELYGYSHQEIADLIPMPLGSVKTYIKQARELLEQGSAAC